MGRTAFIFPGQGAQHLGMGKDFYDECAKSRECFERASDVLGFDVARICFEDEEKLNMTEYTQPAMLTVVGAMLAAAGDTSLKADEAAGLSLGEYGALLAADAAAYDDVIRLVRRRGILMQEACTNGAMAAVLGSSQEIVEDICRRTEGIVTVANYNCPGQLVISGEEEAVRKAGEAILSAGAKRVVKLNVSGPFHSELLKSAGDALAEELKGVELKDPKIPYAANVTAEYVTSRDDIKDLLARQVASSVRWQQSIELMIRNGVETFIEIGPGKTLAGFMKRIDKNAKVISINTMRDLLDVNSML